MVVVFFSTFVSSRVILSIRACKRAVAVSGNSLAELVPPLPPLPECDAVATWSWPRPASRKIVPAFPQNLPAATPKFWYDIGGGGVDGVAVGWWVKGRDAFESLVRKHTARI